MSPTSKRKTRQCDFEALQADDIRSTPADTLLIALGTNRKNAGSAEVFKKVDQDYVCTSYFRIHLYIQVVDFAKAARNAQITQRLVYCSSWGANSSSSGLYLKSKGETEQRLSELGYETIICRVSHLLQMSMKSLMDVASLFDGSGSCQKAI
jgi:oxidoreductase